MSMKWLVYLVIILIGYYARKRVKENAEINAKIEDGDMVYEKKSEIWGGVVIILLGIGSFGLFYWLGREWEALYQIVILVALTLGITGVIGILVILRAANWHIELKDTEMIYHTIWGRVHVIPYSDIEFLTMGQMMFHRLKTKHKVLYINVEAIGIGALLKRIPPEKKF